MDKGILVLLISSNCFRLMILSVNFRAKTLFKSDVFSNSKIGERIRLFLSCKASFMLATIKNLQPDSANSWLISFIPCP